MAIIETNNLTKYYGKIKGIENLNLTVEEGDIFGFIGPNGAGKSTTIRTFLNLIFPSGGSATILGYDIIREAKQLKKEIGYLPSDVNFYEDMTVKELLQYSADFYQVPLGSHFQNLVERFEINISRNLNDLSTGNKKKVAIVQALLHQPKLLILDEPTNGLDPLMQNNFFDVLKEAHGAGTTIFFSSHILSEVQRLCKRVAVIRNGEIVATETMSQLRNKQLKHCRIELEQEAAAADFELAAIQNLELASNHASFNFTGEIKELLNHLQQLKIKDLNIEDPPLEEVFMHYYERNN